MNKAISEHFKKLGKVIEINGSGMIEEVHKEIIDLLEKIKIK